MIVIQRIPEGQHCCGACVEQDKWDGGDGVTPRAVMEMAGFGSEPIKLCATHSYQVWLGLQRMMAECEGETGENPTSSQKVT
jgi:hypothetical protein